MLVHLSCLCPNEMTSLFFMWFREGVCGLSRFERIRLGTRAYLIRYT